jgi:type 1 glutamine amidotransferase
MKTWSAVLVAAASVWSSVIAQPQQSPSTSAPPQPSPLRVFIHAGLKTHAPGQHDYPQFLADWSKLLTDRGATVDGALHFPAARDLANTDVLVIYKGDAGYLSLEDRASLDSFLRKGGGLVSLHDALCGDDPQWFGSILGGAKKHGEVNYSPGEIAYTITDPSNPIMQSVSNLTIDDEAFFKLTTVSGIKVLATAPMPTTNKGEIVPQIWTYERALFPAAQPYRAFVWMQGHNYANFSNPQVQPMLLRGIAWAGKRPVDTLMTPRPARGGRGTAAEGRGRGEGPGEKPMRRP